MRPGIARWLSGLLASVLTVAAASGLNALLKPWVSPLRVLYVLAVLPVALIWGTGLAVFAAVLSAAVYEYLFVPPVHSLRVPDLRSAVALGAFLVTAVITAVLAARMRKAALAAARLSDEQAALRRVATLVARGAPPEEVFVAVTAEIGHVLCADVTSMSQYHADGAATAVGLWSRTGAPSLMATGDRVSLGGRNLDTLVFQTGRPARIDDYDDSSGEFGRAARGWRLRSVVGVPISVHGRLWGVVIVGYACTSAAPADTEQRLADFTELVATAIANAQVQAELTGSRARIVATADETRRRFERDLHDGAQQRLVSLGLQLRAAQARVPPGLGDLAAELDRAAAGLASTLEELQEFARGVHPANLTEAGLALALKTLARRSPGPVQLDLRTMTRLPERVEVTAYYVVSEALANAAKHANASAVTVEVEASGGVLSVSVRDNGVGGADLSRGTGLVGLKDRVEAIGGTFSVHSRPGEGTLLVAELPAESGPYTGGRHAPTRQNGHLRRSGRPGASHSGGDTTGAAASRRYQASGTVTSPKISGSGTNEAVRS